MGGGEVRIGLVERVAGPVVVECRRLRRAVTSHGASAAAALVDVVADMQDEVQVVADHVIVRGEIALFVVLARSHCELEAREGRTLCRCRARAPDNAAHAASRKAVPIFAARFETLRFRVDRMRPFRRRVLNSALYDAAHVLIRRHLPLHGDRRGRHAAVWLCGIQREPRPQHYGAGSRIAACNAERERIVVDRRYRRACRSFGARVEPARRERRERAREKSATRGVPLRLFSIRGLRFR